MEHVATPRLIAATAALDPADRALVNLWIHRGLDDAALARAAGTTPQAITARRLDVVDRLSAELGLPPYEVLAALRELERAAVPEPASPPEHAPPEPALPPDHAPHEAPLPLDARPPVTSTRLVLRAPGPPGPLPPPSRLQRARRFGAAWVLPALVLAAVLVVLLLALDGGAGGREEPRAAAIPLGALADTPAGARGSVSVLRGAHGWRELRISTAGLPAHAGGHYVAWLFNTVIDSRRLADLGPAGGSVVVPVPAGARAYRWIDIAFQPPGFGADSGESLLRVANPLAAPAGGVR